MKDIVVAIFTKNEESNIAACIKSVEAKFDVIVVDSMSTDETTNIAAEYGAELLHFDWNGRLPKKRQWSLDQLKNRYSWVLFLDADERLSRRNLDEIEAAIHSDSENVAYESTYEYHVHQKPLRHGYVVRKKVLLKTDSNHFPDVDDLHLQGMGELEGHFQPVSDGKVGQLKLPIAHDDQDSFGDWVRRHERYARWESGIRSDEHLRKKIRQYKTKQGRIFDRLPAKPLTFFLYSYVIKFGFLDGRAGFDYAFGIAWYHWLVEVLVKENERAAKAS